MAVSGSALSSSNLESLLNFEIEIQAITSVYEMKHPHEKYWRNGCNLQNMKKLLTVLILIWTIATACNDSSRNLASIDSLHYELVDVKINDSFWSPKLQLWQTKTVNDVFDKFEGKYRPQGQSLEKDFKVLGITRNAFLNFDLVADGKRDIGKHHGPPWYDGLIYETIRGSADLLSIYPNAELEARIDGYIDRIAKAQASDPDGYINTYTQLMNPINGGVLMVGCFDGSMMFIMQGC